MDHKEPQWVKYFTNIFYAAIANGIACVIIGIIFVTLGTWGICPGLLALIYLVTPLLLMKLPIWFQYRVFGDVVQISEKLIMFSAVVGGYMGVFVVFFVQAVLQFFISTSAL